MGLRQIDVSTATGKALKFERNMAKRPSKANPTWGKVKAELAGFDRAALLALLQDLYAAAEDNRAFLHSRFGLGQDPLQPYKKIMDRWLWPDIFRGEETSVSRAKRAISNYKKASGDPEGLAELMVYYCDLAAGFCRDVGYQDAAYCDALARMFEQALRTIADAVNSSTVRNRLLGTLDHVRSMGHELGYGIGDDMDVLFAEFVSSSRRRVRHGDR